MHLNVEQILWAVVLAAHLVLLVILLGRERNSRFPWFTAAIAISSIHLIADHLLSGKLTTIAFYWQSYSAVLIGSLLRILVLVELARHVFASGKAGIKLTKRAWTGWTLGLMIVAANAVYFWGRPWPTMAALNGNPKELPLVLLVLSGIKSELFVALLTVMVGLLLRIFGRRFGFGWRSHAEQIALGLSTYSLGFMTVLAITDILKRTVHLTSRAQYDHVMKLFANLDNARFALWAVVLLWWCVWLWLDEPASSQSGDFAAGDFLLESSSAPVLPIPPAPIEAQMQESDTDVAR